MQVVPPRPEPEHSSPGPKLSALSSQEFEALMLVAAGQDPGLTWRH
jgi:hypothetical protein